jgi:isoleucyl-tRNA synthetase
MLAPILAFTADEAWEFIPGKPTGSVHEANWKPTLFSIRQSEQIEWEELFKAREQAFPLLEDRRKEKIIGKSLDASILIEANGEFLERLKSRAEELRELMNVSQLKIEVLKEAVALNALGKMITTIEKADGQKCERCWHWETDIGQNAEHPTICGRCVEAVMQFKA